VVALTATAEHHNTYLKSVGVDLIQLLHLFASAGIFDPIIFSLFFEGLIE
jgi:hypothetical protein